MRYREDTELTEAIRAFNVEAFLRERGLRVESDGRNAHFRCPRCGREDKCYVNVRTKRYICFWCGDRFQGGLLTLIAELTRWPLAECALYVRQAGARVSVRPLEAPPASPAVQLPDNFRLLDDPADPRQQPYWAYAVRRRIRPEQVVAYRMGFTLTGPYAGRLFVPVVNGGRLVSWVARDITGRSARKVLTPPGDSQGASLFNYDAVRGHERIVLTEGVFDALRAPDLCVATFGKKLSDRQKALLYQAKPEVLVFAWDPDADQTAARIGWRLSAFFPRVLIARLPSGMDPAEMDEDGFRRCIDEAEEVQSWMEMEAVAASIQSSPRRRGW